MVKLDAASLKSAPKVAKDLQNQLPVAPELTAADVTAKVDGYLKNRILSGDEVGILKADLGKLPPAEQQKVVADLGSKLKQAHQKGEPVRIAETTMQELAKLPGLAPKLLLDIDRARDKTIHRDVTQNLAKTKAGVSNEVASETRLSNQKAIRDSHNGVKERPIGGSEGVSYDAGVELAKLGKHVEGKIDEKLSPEAKAAKDQLREPVLNVATKVAAEMKTSGTLDAIKDGNLTDAATKMGRDIVKATDMTAVNVEAVEGFVSGAQSMVGKLGTLAKGTKYEKAVLEHGGKFVKGITEFGGKLTAGAKAAKTAQTVAQGATVAAEGAQVAAAGVKVGAAGAKAAGQSVPLLGQALGVITTGMAAVEVIQDCRHKPRDVKRILSSCANLVGQAVGIFVPFVGAATTVGKLAADAAMNAHDKKHGVSYDAGGLKDLAPHASNAVGFLSPLMEGAGYGDAAAKMRSYDASLQSLAGKELTSAEIAKLNDEQRDALMQSLMAAGQEVHKAADEEKGTKNEALLRAAGEGIQMLISCFRKSRKISDAKNPEAEAAKLRGEAMQAAGTTAVVSAAA